MAVKPTVASSAAEALEIPHPEVLTAAEERPREAAEAACSGLFAEVSLDHKGGGCAGGGVGEVGAREVFEIGDDQAKDASRLEVAEDVAEGLAEIFEGEVLEDVGAVNAVDGAGIDGEAFDDVAVLDVAGVVGEAPADKRGFQEGEALLEEKGWTGVEVSPGLRGAGSAPKLHVLRLHGMQYTQRWLRRLNGRQGGREGRYILKS